MSVPRRDRYERHFDLSGILLRAGELGAATLIIDVEPLVAYWDTGRDALDRGLARVLAEVAPGARVVCFTTNSARRPSALPRPGGIEVRYLPSARKPFRTAPYRNAPRPAVVIGDQIATDGALARRLGCPFLQYAPRLRRVPPGPWLMDRWGRVVRPLLFAPPVR